MAECPMCDPPRDEATLMDEFERYVKKAKKLAERSRRRRRKGG